MGYTEHLNDIFDDMRDCALQLMTNRDSFLRRFPILPPSIRLKDGRKIFVSQKSVEAIQAIARTYRANLSQWRKALTQKELAELIARAIGSVMSTSSQAIEFPADLKVFWSGLRQKLAADLAELDRELTHLFGAWVIQGDTLKSIDIGPVRFSMRTIWASDALSAGFLRGAEASGLLNHWQFERAIDTFATDDYDAFKVMLVAGAVGPCPWICSVRISGHSEVQSSQKGLLAARIALATISLQWAHPSEQVEYTGLLYDVGPPRSRQTAMFGDDLFASALGENALRLGLFLSSEDATEFVARTAKHREIVGAALDTFLSTCPTGPKRLLQQALCHSLIWFGEACNEPLEFMAVVKFVAALDTLAKGRGADGICKLVQRRYPVGDMNAPFWNDGMSAKELVKQIYETGRSQIVHGTHPGLTDDLEQVRVRAEALATLMLCACISWLDTYTGPDDLDAFANSG